MTEPKPVINAQRHDDVDGWMLSRVLDAAEEQDADGSSGEEIVNALEVAVDHLDELGWRDLEADADQIVSFDVFTAVNRAADEAGIDWADAELDVVELTDDADLTVAIRDGDPETDDEDADRLDEEDARRVALEAVEDHGLSQRAAADLVGWSTAWVSQQLAEESDRDD